jgi:hypothetical protein
MAKVKLTRSQMAFAAGETLEQFDKRTGGKDPTAGVPLPGGSTFFESDDSDTLIDDEEYGAGSGESSEDGSSDDSLGDDGKEYFDEDDSGDAGGKQSASPKGKKAKVPEWADGDAREFAASYGLSDADLGNFEDLDDLYEYGRKADMAITAGGGDKASDSKSPSGQDGELPDGKKAASKGKTSGVLEKLKPLDRQRYVDAKYGDEELSLVDGLNATIEILREDAERKQHEEFNKVLDDIDPKLFGRAVVDGKIGSLSDAYRNNRLKVHEAMERIASSIEESQKQQGKEVKIPPIPVLAKRAVGVLFGELKAPQSNTSTEAILERSRARRPVSSVGRKGASGGTAGKSVVADPKSIASHPALQRYWKQTQRENGAE